MRMPSEPTRLCLDRGKKVCVVMVLGLGFEEVYGRMENPMGINEKVGAGWLRTGLLTMVRRPPG